MRIIFANVRENKLTISINNIKKKERKKIMKTVTSTMVNPNVEFTIKSIKKEKYANKTYYDAYYEVEFNDGKLGYVAVCKNNAWNYTMCDHRKGLKITYNDEFAYYFKNLTMAFEMINRFEEDLNLGRGEDMFNF